MLLVPTATYAKTKTDNTCKKNPLFCKIIKFNKHIDTKFALELSDKIYKKATASGIDPNVSLAILMQESALQNVVTFKTHTVKERYCEAGKCFEVTKEISEAFDMSIAQINIGTANQYGFDIERLFNKDLDYALDCHYVILKDKLRMCADKDYPWSCYHSINDQYRLLYIELVKRYL